MRLLLALALFVATALPAHAQSDSRRVAIWNMQGGQMGSLEKSMGSRTNPVSATNYLVKIALTRMGVPFTEFNLVDSTGGWARTMRATRPLGMADSTWFRQNGYFMHVMCFSTEQAGSSNYRFFTDGASNRGTFLGSPLDGVFGITLAFQSGAVTNADSGFVNGLTGFSTAAVSQLRQYFNDNNDTTSFYPTSTQFGSNFIYGVLNDPPDVNVTRLVDADTKATAGGFKVLVWKYKKVIYAPLTIVSGGQSVIYGLSQAFRDAGYVPRRKLNVHWSLDHVYPSSVRNAVSDSFFTYVLAMDLRFSGLYTGGYHAGATGNGPGQSNDFTVYQQPRWDVYKDRFYAMPHSHRTGVGMSSLTVADYTTYSDTATWRGYFNMMERAVSDTMGLVPARGYYKSIGLPNNWIHFPQLYMLTQNGYTDVRASESDSVGGGTSGFLSSKRRVFVGCASCIFADHTSDSWWYGDPTDATGRRGINVHEEQSPLGSQDSVWANVAAIIENNIDGKNLLWSTVWTRAALFDADIYFHPNDNLKGATNGNMILNSPMRRLMYFYNRVSNIVSQDPSYRPRRLNIR